MTFLFDASATAAGGCLALAALGVVGLRSKRPRRWTVALLLCAGGLNASVAALAVGVPAPAAFFAVLAPPLLTAATFAVLRPHKTHQGAMALVLLALPTGVAAAWAGLPVGALYGVTGLNLLLGLAFAVPLAESLLTWRRVPFRRAACLYLFLAAVTLVVAGPIYSAELSYLGFGPAADAGLMYPIPAFLAFLAAEAENPLARVEPRPMAAAHAPRFPLQAGQVVLLRERRPKFGRWIFADQHRSGRAAMHLGAGDAHTVHQPHEFTGIEWVKVRPDQAASLPRVTATAAEFLALRPGSVVYLQAMARLLAMHPPTEIADAVDHLRRAAVAQRGLVLVPTYGATAHEVSSMVGARANVLDLPDVEDEVLTILRDGLGQAAQHVVEQYARTEGRRLEDIGLEDLPRLDRVLDRAADSLGAAADDRIRDAWRAEVAHLRANLRRLADASLEDLVTRPWRAPREIAPEPEREPTPPPKTETGRDWEELRSRLEAVFEEHLGAVGKAVLEREAWALHKKRITRADLIRLQERAEAALDAAIQVIDVEGAKEDLRRRAEIVKQTMTEMARGS